MESRTIDFKRNLLGDQENRPTAIFISTEILAFGVLQAASALKLQVPTDLLDKTFNLNMSFGSN